MSLRDVLQNPQGSCLAIRSATVARVNAVAGICGCARAHRLCGLVATLRDTFSTTRMLKCFWPLFLVIVLPFCSIRGSVLAGRLHNQICSTNVILIRPNIDRLLADCPFHGSAMHTI
ncbi:hypothetical protein OE88DRAFT_305565 [Heliocybe sulcata]|uniref:Uncharacterized protein n=1 Tax=Heliocybe sulcata TaxID=5364 RepID=A0A5C3MYQ7_9AGAM|nr:hypothetical protein OE88DRAFT_305565 [Heliocybe sulcata]